MPIYTNPSSVTRFATLVERSNLQVRQTDFLGLHDVCIGKKSLKAKSRMGIAMAVLGVAAVPMAFILIGLIHLV